MKEPRWSCSGPETVPEANRSPVRRRGAVDGQVRELLGRRPVHRARTAGELSSSPLSRTSRLDVQAPRLASASSGTAAAGRPGPAGRPGRPPARPAAPPTARPRWRRTCRGTGPSGTYSQAWMSRADQSLTRHDAEDVLGEVGQRDRVAQRRRRADDEADLGLDVEPLGRAERRARRRPGPCAGRTGGRRACRRRRRCRTGRGSRSAGASSSGSAAAESGRNIRPRLVAWCSEL